EQSAALRLPDTLEGHVFIRDAAGRLVVELRKRAGAPVELGLEPGSYEVTLLQGVELVGGPITLNTGVSLLDVKTLQPLPAEQNPLRGEELEGAAANASEQLWHFDTRVYAADPNLEGLGGVGAYAFPAVEAAYLFRPLRNDPEVPLDLLRFTQRPDELSLRAGLALTRLEASPRVNLSGTFYPWPPL